MVVTTAKDGATESIELNIFEGYFVRGGRLTIFREE